MTERADIMLLKTVGTRRLVFFLSMVTGVVDAMVFFKGGVLPSAMTATTIFLGLHAFLGQWNYVGLGVVAIVTFLGGSILAALLARTARGEAPVHRRLAWAELISLLLLALVGILDFTALQPWPKDMNAYLVVSFATIAMAMQLPQVRVVDGLAVSTTFLTGAMSSLGYGIVESHNDEVRRREIILGTALAAYVAGGLVGGAFAVFLPDWGLAVPGLIFAFGWAFSEIQHRPHLET